MAQHPRQRHLGQRLAALPREVVPVVTYTLIAVDILVWPIELGLGEKFINGYSTVP